MQSEPARPQLSQLMVPSVNSSLSPTVSKDTLGTLVTRSVTEDLALLTSLRSRCFFLVKSKYSIFRVYYELASVSKGCMYTVRLSEQLTNSILFRMIIY